MTEQKRSGYTVTTSVSVSKKFQEIVEKYKLSPTEIYRRGVAVMLYDLGEIKYQTNLNKERSEFVNNFLQDLDKDEKAREEYNKILTFVALRGKIEEIRKLIDEIYHIEGSK